MSFLDPGEGDRAKGAVHGAMLTLAVLIGGYNVLAFQKHRQTQHAVNVVAMALVCGLELVNVSRHCE